MTEGTAAGGRYGDGLIHAADLRERQRHSRERIAAAQARALQAKESMEGATSTATSPDRSVVVTVNPAGTLLDVTFTSPAATKLALPVLARTLLETYRKATLAAVDHTQSVLRDLVGEQSPALDLVRAAVPTDPTEDER